MSSLTALNVSLFGVPGALGGALLYWAYTVLRRERATRRWPRAPGTITSSSVSTADSRWTDQQGDVHETTGHTPNVAYELTVGDRKIRGEKIFLGAPKSYSRYGDAEQVTRRYPVGAAVQVFHDPNDPATAFLETGTPGGAWVLLVMGGVFFSIGLLGVLLFIVLGQDAAHVRKDPHMAKFDIKIDAIWSAPLLLIGATHAKSWAEITDTELDVKFGIGEEKIPLAEIAGVEPHEWSLLDGIGHRIGYGGIGYIGSTDGVVEIKLKRPLSFNLLLGIHKEYPSFFISMADQDGFIAALRERITPNG